jgi:hypothetical protein
MPELAADPEIIEAAGLRWVHIESPAVPTATGWKSTSISTPSTTRTSSRATSARSWTSTTTTLHRAALPPVRQDSGQHPDGELDLFLGQTS